MSSIETDPNVNPSPAYKDRWTFYLYFLLNAASLLFLILLLIEVLSPKRIAIADVGAPMGLVLLFFAIPLFWGMIKIRTRKLTSQERFTILPKYKFIRFAWIIIWLISSAPILFYGSFIYHYSPRPWLESNQGPDTEDSILAFDKYFGTSFKGKVHNIYNQGSPEINLFHFSFNEASALDSIISKFKLKPVTQCYLNIVKPPKWWQKINQNADTQCFSENANGHGAYQLLVNKTQQQIFFMEFNS